MSPLTYIILLVVAVILLSVTVGFYLGRQLTRHERDKTLKVLLALANSTEELTRNVGTHNSELVDVGHSVSNLDATGELGRVQKTLLVQIKDVVVANQRLEDDLVCARYNLETQAQELDRTRREARTDALAGVPNRKAFDEALQYRLSQLKRKGRGFALALADVDHFKWINDTHGHPAGDRVVHHVATFLTQKLRRKDLVARFGGDEFGILLDNVDLAAAHKLCEMMRTGIEQQNFNGSGQGERLAVTLSMGLAIARHGDSVDALLNRADQALYKSKRGGRNQLNSEAVEPTTDAPAVPV